MSSASPWSPASGPRTLRERDLNGAQSCSVTWADGNGSWHVLLPLTHKLNAADLEAIAQRSIELELERLGDIMPDVEVEIAPDHWQQSTDSIVYREVNHGGRESESISEAPEPVSERCKNLL